MFLGCSASGSSVLHQIYLFSLDNDDPVQINWGGLLTAAASREAVPCHFQLASRTGRMFFCCHPSHGGWVNGDILQKDVHDVQDWLRGRTRPVLFVPVASQGLLEGSGAAVRFRLNHGSITTITMGPSIGNSRVDWVGHDVCARKKQTPRVDT